MNARRFLFTGLFTGAIACLTALPAAATQLSGAQIKALVGGKTVRLDTPLGLRLPLRYRLDGVVAGDISGFTMARMFAPREEGRWWVEQDRLCQEWPTWYKGRRFCFAIEKTGGNTISWLRDDGASGTAVIAD